MHHSPSRNDRTQSMPPAPGTRRAAPRGTPRAGDAERAAAAGAERGARILDRLREGYYHSPSAMRALATRLLASGEL
jgi:hypothetical protein